MDGASIGMLPFTVFHPDKGRNALLFNSPHSGTVLPVIFQKQSLLDRDRLYHSSDLFMDQLIQHVPLFGATAFLNRISRVYVDTNRSDREIDPDMFLSDTAQTAISCEKTTKVDRGFGVFARRAHNGQEIYNHRLPRTEIPRRLEKVYYPVHKALQKILDRKATDFGYYLLLDCHSMPSYGFIDPQLTHRRQPDLIIGNRFNQSCNPDISRHIATYFTTHGMQVAFNDPYAGGFNTCHYGNRDKNRHAIQLEFNRALYMDEKSLKPNSDFAALQTLMTGLSENLDQHLPGIIRADGSTP